MRRAREDSPRTERGKPCSSISSSMCTQFARRRRRFIASPTEPTEVTNKASAVRTNEKENQIRERYREENDRRNLEDAREENKL